LGDSKGARNKATSDGRATQRATVGAVKMSHRHTPHAPRFPARQVDRNNAEKTRSGGKKADSFRPDIASRDAPRFGNAFRRFSVRRPVSGLVS
jgi:hypothetical protein